MSKFDGIDIKTLVDLKLGFEAYFVLYCLYKKDSDLILSYIRNCKKIDNSVFDQLKADGYIEIDYIDDKKNIVYNCLTLLDKGRSIFSKELSLATASEEFLKFRDNYPSSVKIGRIPRRLHGNKSRCIKLFMDIRNEGISLEDLSRCARIYIKEKIDSGSQQYIQLLETWLSKRSYEEYMDEAEKISAGGFVDDI